jgi:hypothetical protein
METTYREIGKLHALKKYTKNGMINESCSCIGIYVTGAIIRLYDRNMKLFLLNGT